MRLRALTLNVQNDEGDPRRTGLLNQELRRLAPGGAARPASWSISTVRDAPGQPGTTDSGSVRAAPRRAPRTAIKVSPASRSRAMPVPVGTSPAGS